MSRIIAVASGKGGVGKTSVTVNMGLAMAKLGAKVVMIDTDMQMANLGLMLGMEGRPITLQDVLLGEASWKDAVYDVNKNAKFVPSGLSIDKFKRVDEDKLAGIVKEIASQGDVVLLDTAAGIGTDVLASLNSANELMIITMAESFAVADAMKVILVAERRLGLDITGVSLNMVKGMKQEMNEKDIQKTLQTEILMTIPEDPRMRECSLEGTPLVVKYPSSPAARAITKLAAKLLGVQPPEFEEERKKGILDMILEWLKPKKKRDINKLVDSNKPKK